MVTFFGGGGLSFVSLSLSLSLSPPMGSTHSTSPAQASPCLRLPLGTLTTLRASPASWTCVEKMGWRERERERKEVRGARERGPRGSRKNKLFSYRNCQLTLGALGTLTTLRASPASWTCVERWGGERDRQRERERERERKEVRGARERGRRGSRKNKLFSYRNCQLTLGALTTLRASPASSALPALTWTCVERWGGEREKERRGKRLKRDVSFFHCLRKISEELSPSSLSALASKCTSSTKANIHQARTFLTFITASPCWGIV